MKRALSILFLLVLFAGMSAFSIFRLDEYLSLETIYIQLDSNYQIVFIDPAYMFDISALCIFPFFFVYILWTQVFGKDGSGLMGKLLVMSFAIGLVFAIPGQIFEHQRQKSIARDHGFVDCPPFTLLSSTHIVEAMVKDPQYCTDDEITSIAMYGYFRELPVVNAYVDEVYGKK